MEVIDSVKAEGVLIIKSPFNTKWKLQVEISSFVVAE